MTSSKKRPDDLSSTQDVAKVFFDLFSKRVSEVEQSLKRLSEDLEALKGSSQRSQMSDLVLLERIQRSEGLLLESLGWIKKVAESVSQSSGGVLNRSVPGGTGESGVPVRDELPLRISPIVSVKGELASLSAITTATEMQVLSLLAQKGPMGAPEIGRFVGRSREHTARLMKRLYQEGYVKRDQNRIPFRYSLMDRIRQGFAEKMTVSEPKAQSSDEVSGTTRVEEEEAPLAKPPPN